MKAWFGQSVCLGMWYDHGCGSIGSLLRQLKRKAIGGVESKQQEICCVLSHLRAGGELSSRKKNLILQVADQVRGSNPCYPVSQSTVPCPERAFPSQPTRFTCPTLSFHFSNGFQQLQVSPWSRNANVYQSGWSRLSSPSCTETYPNFHAQCDELIALCCIRRLQEQHEHFRDSQYPPCCHCACSCPITMPTFSSTRVLFCNWSVNLPWRSCAIDWFWSFTAC